MSWRTVYVTGVAKLDFKLNYLVVRKEKIKKIHISEIGLLLIDSTAVSLTTALLSELIKNKVKVIFCDENHNPSSELLGYYNKHNSVKCISKQIKWTKNTKNIFWAIIVREKIYNQYKVLKKLNFEKADLLEQYMDNVVLEDATNREGHAAKVYFNLIFGNDFSRQQENLINAALNYGYTILLSYVNREIVKNGYLTQLGIFHNNQFNAFNLSSDLMEPLRPLVDYCVLNMNITKFEKEEKVILINLFNSTFKINNQNCRFDIALSKYIKNFFEAINSKNIEKLKFIEYEL